MAKKDFRIEEKGKRLNYTCKNSVYMTDTNSGFCHGVQEAKGSVFREALFDDNQSGYTLWLEYVIAVNHDDKGKYYWFMWYEDGRPTIPLSGIFGKEDVEKMARLFVKEFFPSQKVLD